MNKNAMAIAGNTKPTVGTKIEGKNEAAIIGSPLGMDCIFNLI